ncbi:hypothetical protein DV738_g528, partial [Chaetothyriales sp. CBS 135597]
MPIFSYAQAAKGAKAQAPPSKPVEPPAKVEPLDLSAGGRPVTKAEPPTSAPPKASRSQPRAEDKDIQSSPNNTAATPATTPEPITVPAQLVAPSVPGQTTPESSTDKENTAAARSASSRAEPAQPALSGPISPKVASETGSPKEKDGLKKTEHREWEKASQASNVQDKAATTPTDKDRTKESEDDWEKVSVPSIAADKELKAAPLPAVNVWAVRLEAQAAKKKELAAKSTASVNGTRTPSEPSPKAAADEAKRKAATSTDTSDTDLSASFPKPDASTKAVNTDSAPVQSSRPVSQHGDKASAAARLPVDTTSWPTPENATADDRRKSSIQDKTEKPDTAKSATTKSHGNKWIAVPFVPTAKFETPLPALATKRGSRMGRGRDSQARGGAQSATTADRTEPGAAGPAPVANKAQAQAQDQDRGRKPDTARGTRSSSLPASNRRATSRENVLASLRKPAAGLKPEQGLNESPARSTLTEGVNGTAAADSKHQSRSSSRHNGHTTGSRATAEAASSHNAAQNGIEPHSSSTADPPARLGGGQDRPKAGQAHYRASAEASKDRGSHRNRDWSREKADTAREKGESWRDSEFATDSTGRRDRSDRGRGGFRGRGGHGYNSHHPHHPQSYTAPLPQNGFDSAKPHHPEPRSRQSSQPFVPPNPSNPHRANPRSHSIPVGMMYSNFYGVPAIPHIVPQLQTDLPPYAYPSPVLVEQGIMSAMPYSNSLNSYAVLSMVITQFEYYFSIDNLCKDMYLRKNMDSQGWVPLRVIANFKRIKALTEENFPWEMMRFVASQVRNAEHLSMPDGEDKIRSRENWRDFVLPIEDRFPAAQTDGPQLQPIHQTPQLFAPLSQEVVPPVSPPIRSANAAAATTSPNGSFDPTPLAPYAPISPLDGSAAVDRGFGIPLSPPEHAASPPPPVQAAARESPSAPRSQYPRVFRDRPTGQMVSPTPNGHHRQPSRSFTDEVTFPDEGIAGICILMREPSFDPARDDLPQLSRELTNESRTSASFQPAPPAQRGLADLSGPGLQGVVFGYSNALPTAPEPSRFVYKDGLQSEIPADKPGQYVLSYPQARESAFRNRELGLADAMSTMYSFWSSFLVDNFNLGMYQEFKTTSLQDLSRGDDSGIKHLMVYFDKALKSRSPIADAVAADLANFLRDEADGKARVYKIIRVAWRNGALNLKTRKKIGDLLSDEEKASFDKGG